MAPCLLAPRDHGGQYSHELCESPLSAETNGAVCRHWYANMYLIYIDSEEESPDGSLSGNESPASVFTYAAPTHVTHNEAPTLAAPVNNQVIQEQILTACSRAAVFEYAAPAPVTEYIAPAPTVFSDAYSQQLPSDYTTTTVTTDVNLDMVVRSLLPFEEFDALVYNHILQEQIVAEEITQYKVENPSVQEQVIIQGNSELQVMERKQEQNVETTKDVPWERVLQRTVKQIAPVSVPQIQEQVIVQKIPQVVDSFPPLAEFVASMHNQVLQEQIVATIQPHIRFQEIPEVQFVGRIQEQIVETIKVVSQERATQRTSEQFEVQMNTNSQ